jgi:GNAT superfamily N-acetyltransferase
MRGHAPPPDVIVAGMNDLPPRYDVRRATPADAETIHAVIAAYQRAAIGRLDYTLEDVRDELRRSFPTVLDTDAGEPAGLTLRSTRFAPDEKCGYLRLLGVHPAFQGRGLGRWLLRNAFAEDTGDGYTGTILHVDTDPRRPALGLHLSAGMRAVVIIDAWRRVM